MDIETYKSQTRDAMYKTLAEVSPEAAKGKSRAKKEVLIEAYEYYLEAAEAAAPRPEGFAKNLDALADAAPLVESAFGNTSAIVGADYSGAELRVAAAMVDGGSSLRGTPVNRQFVAGPGYVREIDMDSGKVVQTYRPGDKLRALVTQLRGCSTTNRKARRKREKLMHRLRRAVPKTVPLPAVLKACS